MVIVAVRDGILLFWAAVMVNIWVSPPDVGKTVNQFALSVTDQFEQFVVIFAVTELAKTSNPTDIGCICISTTPASCLIVRLRVSPQPVTVAVVVRKASVKFGVVWMLNV